MGNTPAGEFVGQQDASSTSHADKLLHKKITGGQKGQCVDVLQDETE